MAAFVPALSLSTPTLLQRSSLCGARISQSVSTSSGSIRMGEKSPAMPFLPKPANLKEDMVGYVGFDPLGLSNAFDIKWLQQAEIKHGRVCMLAFLGIIAQEFVHLPGPEFQNPLATEAFYQVPAAGLWQIVLFCGLVEFISHKGRISYLDMFDENEVPGELGFNPLKFTADDSMKLKEIKNGRLAMCGVGGVIHSMFLFKTPIISQMLDFKPIPLPL